MATPTLDIDRFRRGDSSMVQRFFTIICRRVRRFRLRGTRAQSVAQDALVELLTKLRHGSHPDQPEIKTWVLTAASNAARRTLNRDKRIRLTYGSEIRPYHTVPTLSEILYCHEVLDEVDRILAQMPETVQRAFVATAIEGRTIESVAAEQGVSAGAMSKKLQRTRKKFTRVLTDQEKLDRLYEFACEVRRIRQQRGHDTSPFSGRRSRPRARADSSSLARR